MIRKATAVWRGSGRAGDGDLSTDSGVLAKTPYSYRTRFENEKGTNPEELIAAAHAGCFAMSLAAELSRLRLEPRRLSVSATCVMDEVEGKGHLVVASELRVRADVPGLEAAILDEAVARADAGCPISTLIRGTATVELAYELV